MDRDKPKDFTENEAEFKFDFSAYCCGRTIRGIRVSSDRIELHLDAGRAIAFRADGPDIEVTIAVPKQSAEPGMVQ